MTSLARRPVALRLLAAAAALACAACSATSLTPKTLPGTGIHPIDSIVANTVTAARAQKPRSLVVYLERLRR
jgi:hypothetical protein